jgi:hypothetical protein
LKHEFKQDNHSKSTADVKYEAYFGKYAEQSLQMTEQLGLLV